jgi:putative MATE family efflux protein
MEKPDRMELFRSAPVPKAVMKNALPSMAAMLMVLVYNLADTFFISLTKNDYQVAAVSMVMPVFLIMMAVGFVFGIGGTSVISRALGEERLEYAKKVCAFCFWSCIVMGMVLGTIYLVFIEQILKWMGTSSETYGLAKTYLTITACSAPVVLVANCYSHIVRAEGFAGKAMAGQLLGNILNIILDPIMILSFRWGIAGAAIATVIGNVFSAGYYILHFLRGKSALSIHPKEFTLRNKVCSSVLAIGVPASLGSLIMCVSQITLNSLMSTFNDMAVAGIGVAGKVLQITTMVSIGFGQGVQPLLGFCVGARLWGRFKKVMRFSVVMALLISSAMTICCLILDEQLVSIFLTEKAAFDYALQFVRILLTTSWLFGAFYVFTNSLQAAGAAKSALIINISRQGLIYIPSLFILKSLIGIRGLAWAQPVADVLSTTLVIILFVITIRQLMKKHPEHVSL